MGFDRVRIKENAKKHYSINKSNAVIVALIMTAAGGVVGYVSGRVSGNQSGSDAGDLSIGVLALVAGAGIINTIVTYFVLNIIQLGGVSWFQKSINRTHLEVSEMFAGFRENYGSNVLMMFLIQLFTALWTCLFIIPGIVKTYAYSMAPYIKMENPNIGAGQAIDISKDITNGHKSDLFVLDLSFIGWFLLSGLTFGILMIVYVGPYYYAARAFAYEELKAEAISSGKVDGSLLNGGNTFGQEM